jgi:metallophosphoesterase (TIGR00282 family)
MRVLFVGDVFGKAGRRVLKEKLPGLLAEQRIDFCVANVENAAGGFGITPPIVEEMLGLGLDLLTSGNHIWDKRIILPYLDQQPRLLRPHNYPDVAPGTGMFIGDTRCGATIGVLNLQGRVYMQAIDCPFRSGEAAVEQIRKRTNLILIDFHGEATSEKQAFAWYVDGRVSAVVGTHTHVQTADERVLPRGTAYITDVGMTGPYDSVIGSITDFALERFIRQIPVRLEPANANPRLCGAVIEINEATGLADSIVRLNLGGSPQ